jgi:hypothetical protein
MFCEQRPGNDEIRHKAPVENYRFSVENVGEMRWKSRGRKWKKHPVHMICG